jgi:hypothetical protein
MSTRLGRPKTNRVELVCKFLAMQSAQEASAQNMGAWQYAAPFAGRQFDQLSFDRDFIAYFATIPGAVRITLCLWIVGYLIDFHVQTPIGTPLCFSVVRSLSRQFLLGRVRAVGQPRCLPPWRRRGLLPTSKISSESARQRC